MNYKDFSYCENINTDIAQVILKLSKSVLQLRNKQPGKNDWHERNRNKRWQFWCDALKSLWILKF